jgi:hypothetical protein
MSATREGGLKVEASMRERMTPEEYKAWKHERAVAGGKASSNKKWAQTPAGRAHYKKLGRLGSIARWGEESI